MQFKTLIFATLASVAVAQTATSAAVASTATSTCAAQNILDACIGIIKGQVNACAYSDYSCLCTQYINMLTCYNNCPNDSGLGTVQSLREQYCSAASVYGSTTTLGTAPATSASTSATSTHSNTSAASGFATGSSSGSGSGSSASETSSSSSSSSSKAANGAESLTVGGVFALCAAGVAALL